MTDACRPAFEIHGIHSNLISFSNLRAQNQPLREELLAAVAAVLDSGQFILGRHVEQFERAFADYCGVRHAFAVNSGTSALHLALLAAGVEPGDEVVTVPFTFAATVAAIHYCGARPVFADIEPRSFHMDPASLARAITPKTRAILPVQLFGQMADMDAVLAIARPLGIPVIEDAAQAHGAEYGREGKRAGSIGDLGCFSFYPTKNLGACGEGGMVTTGDDELARKVGLFRDWGQDRKYHHLVRGFNYRMEGLQGALLSVKLPHIEGWTEARRAMAARYDALFGTLPASCGIAAPWVRPGAGNRHVYHTYTIRTPRRDELQQFLTAAGIGSAIHYPRPLHLQPAYADPAFPEGSLPEAEKAAAEVLSLPIYAEMNPADADAVVEAIARFWASAASSDGVVAAIV